MASSDDEWESSDATDQDEQEQETAQQLNHATLTLDLQHHELGALTAQDTLPHQHNRVGDQHAPPPPPAQDDEHAGRLARAMSSLDKKIKRQRADLAHRVGLLGWLAHGRLLSEQADSTELQRSLVALLPADEARVASPTLGALKRMARSLDHVLEQPPSMPAGGVAAQRVAQERERVERQFRLALLLERARARDAPDWAAGGADAARLELSRLAAPAVARDLSAASVKASTDSGALQQLAHDALANSLMRAGADDAPRLDVLSAALESRSATADQRLLLLVAHLRGVGLRARLVVCLQPPPRTLRAAPSAAKLKKGASEKSPPAQARRLPAWLEVYLPAEERFVCFDPQSGKMDEPEMILGARAGRKGSRRATAYVVAFGCGEVVDVTKRYAAAGFDSMRTDASWWATALGAVDGGGRARRGGSATEAIDVEEEGGLGGASGSGGGDEAHPLPQTLNAFKHHPVYSLARDIGAQEVLHPADAKPVGVCKGQSFYMRAHIRRVATRSRWFREGRLVRDDAQMVKTRARKRSTADAAPSAEDDEGMPLYGEWQTDPYEPPPAVDGIVPRSEHNHVELWTEKHLPRGTVHLRDAYVAQAAKKLGVDCAPAMVGFDRRQGRSVPRFDGVVVCAEVAEALHEAAGSLADDEAERQRGKDHARVVANWQAVLAAMRVRVELDARYGKV